MPFLPPNQQRQSTEGTLQHMHDKNAQQAMAVYSGS